MDYARRKEEYRARIKGLRLIDDDFMTCFFRDNIEGTSLFVQIVLGRGCTRC